MSQTKRCDKCHYYQATGKDYRNGESQAKGECRVQPPQPSSAMANEARFPLVWADDWCGVFMSADEVKANEAAAAKKLKLAEVDDAA